MKTIDELKKEKQDRYTALFAECGVFFAFSDKQFAENKTPLSEGEKYVAMRNGGYLPKSKVPTYLNSSKAIEKWYKDEVKNGKLAEQEILYELQNHECFYTQDIEDVLEILPYTSDEIWAVFHKYKNKQ